MADLINPGSAQTEPEVIPPIARSHSIQRLRIGSAGLAAIVLMVGLASVVMDRIDRAEATIEPVAGDDLPAEADIPSQNDPLADAGLVPDLPAEPASGTASPAAAPSTGTAPANEAGQN